MKKVIIGLTFSLGGLYLAFRRVDVAELGDVLKEANLAWITLGVVLIVLSVIIRAARWRILVASIAEIELQPLFAATMIGYFGNGVLPLRLGELLRAYAISKMETSIGTASAFGTIVVERFLDLLCAMALMIMFFLLYEVPSWLSQAGVFLGILVIVGSVVLWWISKSHGEWLESLEKFRVLQQGAGLKVKHLIHSFVQGLVTLSRTSRVGILIVSSTILWLLYWLVTLASASALSIELSWVQVGVMLIATTLVISVPSAPGYIGTYHVAAVWVMSTMYHESMASAQAYAILNHAVGFVPLVAIGFYYLLSNSIGFGEIKGLEIKSME